MRNVFRRFSTRREAWFFLTHPRFWFRKYLTRDQLVDDPMEQFGLWFDAIDRTAYGEFPNAMCLSTLNENGYPEGRVVLMKEYDERGIVFYTNTLSRKGKSLTAHPKASVTFYWGDYQRQVRMQGDVELVSETEADAYFSSRPRLSQIAAWASKQSEAVTDRSALDASLEEYKVKFAGEDVPRPPHWSGYRLKPIAVEFWQLGLNRLHDRFRYDRGESGEWTIRRLQP